MAEKNMDAKISVDFEESSSRQQLNSGEDITTLFGKIRKFFSDLKAVAFSGSYYDLSDTPESLPANGGNADTVNGHTVNSDVPENAVFTDTVPDLSTYATKAELDTKAEKALYGNNGLNLGRLTGSTVGFLSSTMGRANAATGGYSFSQGFDNKASGVASFAGGQSSAADGENALAHGYFVKTTKDNEKAFGVYNKSSSDTLFSVGDGTSDSERHNAFEITTTGGKLHDKDIATTDLIPAEINVMTYTVTFSEVTWTQSYGGKGKYYSYIDPLNVNKIISVNVATWEAYFPDELIIPCIKSDKQITLTSNTAKSTGKMAFLIAYI